MKLIKELHLKMVNDRGVIYTLFSEREKDVMWGRKIVHIVMKEECMRCGEECISDEMIEKKGGMICEKCIEAVRI